MQLHDLLASHRIISLLETSKANAELIIDEFPGIYAIIDRKFQIMRCNQLLTNYFQCSFEYILGKDFLQLFKDKNLDYFLEQFQKLESLPNISFELTIDEHNSFASYFWSIKKIKLKNKNGEQLYCIIGNDISELRDKEKKLHQIFGSIPIGVIVVGQGGITEEECSEQTYEILKSKTISGKSFKDVLFAPCWEELSKKEKLSINKLVDVVGKSLSDFVKIEKNLPKQIFFPLPELAEKGRWLDFIWRPIIYNDTIKKILLVIQDKTEQVLSQRLQEKARILEDDTVARIVQLKKCEPELIAMFISEIQDLFSDLEIILEKSDSHKLFSLLHTIKGSSRTAGFRFLTNYIHNLETVLSKMINLEKLDWAIIQLNIREIKNEWQLLCALYENIVLKYGKLEVKNAFDSSANDIKNILLDKYKSVMGLDQTEDNLLNADRIMLAIKNCKFSLLEGMEGILTSKVNETAKFLNKNVQLHFEWNCVRLEEKAKKDLNSCFIHLLTNAIDHGIELPMERTKNNKNPTGNIYIKTWEDGDIVYCTIEDDGRGPSLEKIKMKAIEKKILSANDVEKLKDEQIFQFVFLADFSTSEEITEVSGRGIGLDVVSGIMKELKGSIQMERGALGGCKFSLNLVTDKRTNVSKKYYSLHQLELVVAQRIKGLADAGFNIDLAFVDESSVQSRGIFYGDLDRLILSLTTYVGYFANKLPVSVSFQKYDSFFECQVKASSLGGDEEERSKVDETERCEFSLAIPSCEDFILQHGGSVVVDNNQMIIRVGKVLSEKETPVLNIGINTEIQHPESNEFLKKLAKSATLLNIQYELIENAKNQMNLYVSDQQSCENSLLSLTFNASKSDIANALIQCINLCLINDNY